ncbi:MAG: VOC family protein [Acidimicrobiales bacterium]
MVLPQGAEPSTTKNRVHVDLVDPNENRVWRLVELGARVIEEHDLGFHRWTVMQDPEGHVFCVAAKVYTG